MNNSRSEKEKKINPINTINIATFYFDRLKIEERRPKLEALVA